MVRRSSIVFAASLAVLATLTPATAAAPAGHAGVDRPRYLLKHIKRQVFTNNTRSSTSTESFNTPPEPVSLTDILDTINSLLSSSASLTTDSTTSSTTIIVPPQTTRTTKPASTPTPTLTTTSTPSSTTEPTVPEVPSTFSIIQPFVPVPTEKPVNSTTSALPSTTPTSSTGETSTVGSPTPSSSSVAVPSSTTSTPAPSTTIGSASAVSATPTTSKIILPSATPSSAPSTSTLQRVIPIDTESRVATTSKVSDSPSSPSPTLPTEDQQITSGNAAISEDSVPPTSTTDSPFTGAEQSFGASATAKRSLTEFPPDNTAVSSSSSIGELSEEPASSTERPQDTQSVSAEQAESGTPKPIVPVPLEPESATQPTSSETIQTETAGVFGPGTTTSDASNTFSAEPVGESSTTTQPSVSQPSSSADGDEAPNEATVTTQSDAAQQSATPSSQVDPAPLEPDASQADTPLPSTSEVLQSTQTGSRILATNAASTASGDQAAVSPTITDGPTGSDPSGSPTPTNKPALPGSASEEPGLTPQASGDQPNNSASASQGGAVNPKPAATTGNGPEPTQTTSSPPGLPLSVTIDGSSVASITISPGAISSAIESVLNNGSIPAVISVPAVVTKSDIISTTTVPISDPLSVLSSLTDVAPGTTTPTITSPPGIGDGSTSFTDATVSNAETTFTTSVPVISESTPDLPSISSPDSVPGPTDVSDPGPTPTLTDGSGPGSTPEDTAVPDPNTEPTDTGVPGPETEPTNTGEPDPETEPTNTGVPDPDTEPAETSASASSPEPTPDETTVPGTEPTLPVPNTSETTDSSVVPKPESSSDGLPPIVVLPTASPTLVLPTDSSKPPIIPMITSSSSGIVFGPSGIITSGQAQPTVSTPVQTGNNPASQSPGPGVFPSAPTQPLNSQGAATSRTAIVSGSPASTGGAVIPINSNPPSQSAASTNDPNTLSATGVLSNAPSAAVSNAPQESGAQNGVSQVSEPSASEPSVVPASNTGGAQTSNTLAAGFTGPSATDSGALPSGPAATPTGSQSVPSGPEASNSIGQAGTTEPGATGTANPVSPTDSSDLPGVNPITTPGSVPSESAIQPAPSDPTAIIENPVSSQAFINGPHSVKPTGTDTLTTQPLPSSIIGDTSETAAPTQSESPIATGIPSSLPHVITPPGGAPQQPANTTLIQIGFLYPLNYPFVLANSLSQRQIFKYMPDGIAYGLQIPKDNVTMQTLRAYDTTKDLHYITTLALTYIPSNLVDKLALDLHTPAADIYKNPDPSIDTLFQMINPALPIRADDTMGSTATSGVDGSPSSTATGEGKAGAPIGGNLANDMPVRPSSVGIGVGVVAGAAAYGAAMFFVARRYKQRRLSHQRSPSLLSSPVMSASNHDFASAALMSGARMDGGRSTSPLDGYGYGRNSRGSGRSGSTGRQQISAPVMAENSLGWN